MTYKVVRRFKENKHKGLIYNIGDEYPAQGQKASKTRLEELSTGDNAYNQIYIEEVVEENPEKLKKVEDSKVESVEDRKDENVEDSKVDNVEKEDTPDKDKE